MVKKSQATKKPVNQAVSLSRIRINKLILDSWLILQGFFGIFILLALFTFSPKDPGWNTQVFYSNDVYLDSQIYNAVGSWGAYISDFLFSFFGYMAYVVVYWLLWPLIRHFFLSRNRVPFSDIYTGLLGLKVFGWVLVVLSGSTLFSLILEPGISFLPQEGGGLIGAKISSLFILPLSLIGSLLLFISLLLLGLTLSLEVSWSALILRIQKYLISSSSSFGENLSNFLNTLKEKQQLRKEKIERQEKAIFKAKEKEQLKPAEVIKQKPKIETSKRAEVEKQTELFEYKEPTTPPKLSLLDENKEEGSDETSENSLRQLGELVVSKLAEYNINDVSVESIQPGPVVIRLELKLPSGWKVNQISNISKDLARSLAKTSVRIVEVIEGRDTIGIEVPREDRQAVSLSEVLSSKVYDDSKSPITVALGKDISGSAVVADLASMPHLLVAGTTGSGKSVAINSMLISILYKASPEQVRLILIDPKMLELSVYEDIPHLLAPVITDMKEASSGLRWCVNEMEKRYKLMAHLGVRNLNGYNKKVAESISSGSPIKDPTWKINEAGEDEEAPDLEQIPLIVLAVDELADLMMVVGKTAEQLIARIAQKARAAGIHMLLATQRPSVDVITGLIKANISSRVAFQVASKMDSRVILDQGGAEQLLGNGDMLYLAPGTSIPQRVHGAFVGDDEVRRVADDWRQRGKAEYLEEVTKEEGAVIGMPGIATEEDQDGEKDELYDEAVAFVAQSRRASISAVQRRLRVGYNRAARIIETMEGSGIVSPMESNGNREVLIPPPPED
ncbi:MAG TPA: DNA translocase FtsK 4TM domain-containing protein [SAR86 cluster bacterium]|nr:DNA translocase FtsK 4TM domain-containing protein [SAR86 cluster bacterium]